jgi:hypothetical protein
MRDLMKGRGLLVGWLVAVAACGPAGPGGRKADLAAAVRGGFISEAQMTAERKQAQEKHEPCAKWCGGPTSDAAVNPKKPGCTEEICRKLYLSDKPDEPKRFYKRCEGSACTDCLRSANTYYSFDCPDREVLDGCVVSFASMSGCE